VKMDEQLPMLGEPRPVEELGRLDAFEIVAIPQPIVVSK
jgi:hypothetical protein